MIFISASRYDLPSVTQAPSPWGEGRGLRGSAALVCGIEVMGRGLLACQTRNYGKSTTVAVALAFVLSIAAQPLFAENERQFFTMEELLKKFPQFSGEFTKIEYQRTGNEIFLARPPFVGGIGSIIPIDRQLESIPQSDRLCKAYGMVTGIVENHQREPDRQFYRIVPDSTESCNYNAKRYTDIAQLDTLAWKSSGIIELPGGEYAIRHYEDALGQPVLMQAFRLIDVNSWRWRFIVAWMGGGHLKDGRKSLFDYHFPLGLGVELE